jgi:hypothetical protein
MQVHQSPDLFIPFRLISGWFFLIFIQVFAFFIQIQHFSGNFNFMFYSLVQATMFTALYSGILLFALIHGEDPKPWDSIESMINLVHGGDYKFVVDRFNYEASW